MHSKGTVKNKNAIIVFAKYPVFGKVKTRLASTMGNEFAFKFYNIAAKHTFELCKQLKSDSDIFLFYTNCEDDRTIKNWVEQDFYFVKQTGIGLGIKMRNAFKYVFEKGYEKVVIIGTDVLDHSKGNLQLAFSELEKNDVVIGPSYDGGYYLLGMNKYFPFLFEDIEWSSSKVFPATENKLKTNNTGYSVLISLTDIDDESDLNFWFGNNNGILKERIDRLLKSASH